MTVLFFYIKNPPEIYLLAILKILFKKCTIAVIGIAISIGKKRLKTANKIVPNPKPEKNVNNEPINAERIIITNAKPKYDFVRTNIRLT